MLYTHTHTITDMLIWTQRGIDALPGMSLLSGLLETVSITRKLNGFIYAESRFFWCLAQYMDLSKDNFYVSLLLLVLINRWVEVDKATQELKTSTMLLPMKSHGTALPHLLLQQQHRDQVKEHMVRSKFVNCLWRGTVSSHGMARLRSAISGFCILCLVSRKRAKY